MVSAVFRKVFGTRNDRLLKRYNKTVKQVNALEDGVRSLDDAALRAKSDTLRERYSQGESLDDLLPEAFAVAREAARRTLGMRHFDVQLIGGMALHEGRIAEMRTGEGKTLVAPLAVYLHALSGKGAHVVTVNDYLAQRDAAWMGKMYTALGLSVGVIVAGMDQAARKASYACDVVYGTNNEFGFDYLRDNMAFDASGRVQRGLNFAVVDEVDSILIDEARTPLIISGPTGESSELYMAIDKLIPRLTRQQEEEGPGDYSLDEKNKQALLTEEGHQRVEKMLSEDGLLSAGESLYDVSNIGLMHHLSAALRAHALFQKDVDYIVRDKEIVIVDEFTGRTMPGRRWSEGLHQAVEAKEGVPIQRENQTLASITFQNYFRLYNTLSGMTGTADTEAYEFAEIYGLEVVIVPTHEPMVRADHGDLVYLTLDEKYAAIIEDIKECAERGQPVLVGTASIESSERLSSALDAAGIGHQVLNAKHHEAESKIIAHAGQPGSITIATNMAGRGTDIVLGGSLDAELTELGEDPDPARASAIKEDWQARHDQVIAAGGLHIVGTERHESRRVDNQLRGRSGRQGDPGSSRFYLALEDSLMRIFASDKVSGLMQRLGMQEGESIEHPWVSRAIENAQRKVEAHNFDIRKQLLEYDDVANDQRKVVYQQRNELMEEEDISDSIAAIRHDVVEGVISQYVPPESLEEQWDTAGLGEALEREFGVQTDVKGWLEQDESLHEEPLRERIHERIKESLEAKEQVTGSAMMRRFEKDVMLQILDNSWKEHLAAMDYLRQGIGLRGFAQKNPKQEYKREAFEMFQQMLERIKHEVVSILAKVQVRSEQELDEMEQEGRKQPEMEYRHAEASALEEEEAGEPQVAAAGGGGGAVAAGGAPAPRQKPPQEPFRRAGRKMGRNEQCWCGSGKKFKQCHGKVA